MNAPWKTGSGSGRDQFAAFVCDEATLDVLRPLAVELGWKPEKCAKGGLRHAVQSLSITASPNILMVDLSESADPLNDINALAEVCEPGTVVIAIGKVNDVRLYRDLIASGIHDYLLKPLSPGVVRDTLTQAQAVFTAPKAHDPAAGKSHVSTAVIGTRGGVGASTIATSLAWLFSTEEKHTTALFDLDIHFGTGALSLDLEPGRGLTDAVENPSRIDGLFIERAMIRANENLAILSAEAPINMPLMTDGSAFMQLQEEFRQAFEMSVIDMPRSMLVNFPQLIGEIGVLVIVTEFTLASARDAIRILSWLKANAPQARVLVVTNKVQPGTAELSKADFEASIEAKIDVMIPYDAKAAANAAKLGKTFADANRATRAAASMRDLANVVLGASSEDFADDAKAGKAKKFDLMGMMSKKKTAEAAG
jgi:pilus assembly protein CpaE